MHSLPLRKVSLLLLACGAGFALPRPSPSGPAQRAEWTYHEHHLNPLSRPVPLALPEGLSLEVALGPMSPRDWLAVAPVEGERVQVRCGLIQPETGGHLPLYGTHGCLEASGDGFRVSHPQPSAGVVVYLEVPEGRQVILRNQGALVFRGAVEKGLVFRRGRLSRQDERLDGGHFVFELLDEFTHARKLTIRPPSGPADEGRYTVNFDLLKKRFKSYVEPPFQEGSGVKATLLVELRIEEDGSVSRVRVLKGTGGPLDRQAVETLSQWRFEPFLVDGKAVPVRTMTILPVRSGL